MGETGVLAWLYTISEGVKNQQINRKSVNISS